METNTTPSDPILGSTTKAKSPLSDRLISTAPLDGFRDAAMVFTRTLEELFTGANDKIQQLLSQIAVLEEQATEQNLRIKSLEDQVASKDTLNYQNSARKKCTLLRILNT